MCNNDYHDNVSLSSVCPSGHTDSWAKETNSSIKFKINKLSLYPDGKRDASSAIAGGIIVRLFW